jgi:ABC-2 type transport system permease protein
MVLPLILIGLAGVFRWQQGKDNSSAVVLLSDFGMGLLIPLLCLIAGTGAIGPEIDDGSIVYVLAKPLSRVTIVLSKLATAIVVVTVFGALPMLLAGFVMVGGSSHLAIGYALGAFIAGLTYCALFLLLAILTRNAVVTGLLYALIWEGVVGGYIPGAKTLSIRQWALSITEKLLGSQAAILNVKSAVSLPTAIVLLAVLFFGATGYAGVRLRSLRLTGDE